MGMRYEKEMKVAGEMSFKQPIVGCNKKGDHKNEDILEEPEILCILDYIYNTKTTEINM